MGYFSNLYLVEAESIDDKTVEISTTVYEGEFGRTPYFSWLRGKRVERLRPYANGTIYSSIRLSKLEGYPVKERQVLGEKTGHIPPSILIEAQFTPQKNCAAVCHMIMPQRYLPRRDLEPLVQPSCPYVNLLNEQVILTWPIQSVFDIKFCVTPLDIGESFNDYPIRKILHPEHFEPMKYGIEINLGLVKFKFGKGA